MFSEYDSDPISILNLQPVFLADSALRVCRELATNLLAGVEMFNPFIINTESFR